MQTSTLNLCSQKREYAFPRFSHQWIANATAREIRYVEVFKLPYYCALPVHIKEGRFQCSGDFDMEAVSCFPLRKLAFTLGWDQVNTNNWYVWWSWQRRWEVIKIVLTHYFKQTERASMRGIKEREEIWQGSPGCSLKEASVLQEKPSSRDELLLTTVRQVRKKTHINFYYLRCAFACVMLRTCCTTLESFSKSLPGSSSHPVIQGDWPLAQDTPQAETWRKPGLQPSPGLLHALGFGVPPASPRWRQNLHQAAMPTIGWGGELGSPEAQSSQQSSSWFSMIKI